MSEILFSSEQSLILDLNDQEASEIKYEVNNFPDGQKSIEILGPLPTHYVTIKSKCMWADLELIVAANLFIKDNYPLTTFLLITYLGGGRSDRRFNDKQVNYLRDVIAPVINSCNFQKVALFDPHSDVSEAVIKKSYVITNYEFVKEVMESVVGTKCLIIPDQGAYKKSHIIEDLFDKVVCCTKTRDLTTGRLSLNVPVSEIDPTDKCFVVDDICDFGRTFLKIGEHLKFLETKPELVVSHGIFSDGFLKLMEIYGKIHTTDSYENRPELTNVLTYNI